MHGGSWRELTMIWTWKSRRSGIIRVSFIQPSHVINHWSWDVAIIYAYAPLSCYPRYFSFQPALIGTLTPFEHRLFKSAAGALEVQPPLVHTDCFTSHILPDHNMCLPWETNWLLIKLNSNVHFPTSLICSLPSDPAQTCMKLLSI